MPKRTPSSSFTLRQRNAIRRAYNVPKRPTMEQLAAEWDTTAGTICRIVNTSESSLPKTGANKR